MHRVRTSLGYFAQYGWEAEVVTVDEQYSHVNKDELLLQSLPDGVKIHKIKALDKKWCSRIGLGSLAFRSIFHYRAFVNRVLKSGRFNLIYFSTTEFPICALGAYWKKRFGVPYVIDMQDPWYTGHHNKNKAASQSAKHQLVYQIHKVLEPIAMEKVDGLISVSDKYIIDLKNTYPQIKNVPAATITFGAYQPDLDIAASRHPNFSQLLSNSTVNIVYIGRGGVDMHKAIAPVFKAMQRGLRSKKASFEKLRFYFIGTSYAPSGFGQATIRPLASEYGIESYVTELTDRIGYYHALATLQQADALFIPGSDDSGYTASKIYPYLLSRKPLLAIFHPESSVVSILNQCTENVNLHTLDQEIELMEEMIFATLLKWGEGDYTGVSLKPEFAAYSAEALAKQQTLLFDSVIGNKGTNINA